MPITLSESEPKQVTGWAPFALGFRPFFLLAGLGGMVLMGLWVGLWHTALPAEHYYGRVGWHSHEMLFGYAVAVIAGFLLTAVRNWTGIDTVTGKPLAMLAGLWLLARILAWIPILPGWLIALVDLAFLPLLLAALFLPLWRGANRVNRIFVGFIALMFGCNLLVHGDALGWWNGMAWRGTQGMIDAILLIMIFVAGRVVPFFAERAIAGATTVTRKWVETAGYVLLGCVILAHLLDLPLSLAGALLVALGVVQGIRLFGWHAAGIRGIPILWVLYAGYIWLVCGLLMLGFSHLGWLARSPAIHMLTVGAIGVTTFGMMARVAIGHTGRQMIAAKSTVIGFWLLNIAVVIRAILPLLIPEWWWIFALIAGVLWTVAFGMFLYVYLPILLRPRVDGAPG